MRRLSLRTHRIALGAMLSALAAVLACTGDDPLLVGPGAGDAGGPTSDSGGDATGGGDSSTDGSAGGCPGGQTKCGATCIPTDSDRANCGWCGHDCGAATCAGGKCAITSVANIGTGIAASDGSFIYYGGPAADGGTTFSSLYKVSANGGTPAPVNDFPCTGATATHVVANKACVACNYSDTGTNVFCTQIGISPTTPFGGTTSITAPAAAIAGISSDGSSNPQTFWWSFSQAGAPSTGYVVGYNGGIVYTADTKDFASPSRPVGDTNNVYWAWQSEIRKGTLTGNNPAPLFPSQSAAADIALSGAGASATLVWRVTDGAAAYTTIVSGSVAGGSAKTLTTKLADIQSIAADAVFVYFADSGTIGRIPLAGGPQDIYETGETGATHLVVDKARVFWKLPSGQLRMVSK